MTSNDPWPQEDEVLAGPFKVTPGFIVFLGVLLMPAILALAVYIGAALVANDVYAAEQAPATTQQSSVRPQAADQAEAAGWKRALVGICPLH